jgi:DUF971 family protein
VNVVSIDVERERGVTLVFDDGHSCFFANSDLRAQCPCATCRGLRDRGDVVEGAGVSVRAAELVGNWGISFDWSDGHGTGIYPFESLREWCDAEP